MQHLLGYALLATPIIIILILFAQRHGLKAMFIIILITVVVIGMVLLGASLIAS